MPHCKRNLYENTAKVQYLYGIEATIFEYSEPMSARSLNGTPLIQHATKSACPAAFLYFLPLPQGQGSLRPIFGLLRTTVSTDWSVTGAVVLSALGGVVGIVLAFGASIGVSALMRVPFVFNLNVNVLSFLFSAGIGVVFGYFPARRAAQLDPIEELRHE